MECRITLLVIVGFILASCQGKRNSLKEEITGIYVREYSYKVVHPSTGQEIGMRTIRDSIFIEAEGDRYEVSNNKWKQNDYDDRGWQNMKHAEIRPSNSYVAKFNLADSSIRFESRPILYLNLAGGLFIGKEKSQYYERVQ